MTVNVDLIKASLERLESLEEIFGARFFAKLFTKNPHFRPLFSESTLEYTRDNLLHMIRELVGYFCEPDTLEDHLLELGHRHAIAGARQEHFPAFGEAFVETMADVLGPEWTREMAAAWDEAYHLIAAIMKQGMTATTRQESAKTSI